MIRISTLGEMGFRYSPFQLAVIKKDELLLRLKDVVELILICPSDIPYEHIAHHQFLYLNLKHLMSRDVMLNNNKYFSNDRDTYNFWAVLKNGSVERLDC